jgi:hypothetical protein
MKLLRFLGQGGSGLVVAGRKSGSDGIAGDVEVIGTASGCARGAWYRMWSDSRYSTLRKMNDTHTYHGPCTYQTTNCSSLPPAPPSSFPPLVSITYFSKH